MNQASDYRASLVFVCISAVFICLLVWGERWVSQLPFVVIIVVSVIAVLAPLFSVGLFFSGLAEEKRQQAKADERERVRAFFDAHEEHVAILRRVYERTTFRDEFGDWQFDAWFKELDEYIEEKMVGTGAVSESVVLSVDVLDELNERWAKAAADGHHGFSAVDEGEDGTDRERADRGREFERECMELLESAGWDCHLTPVSGDQGVDIIATLGPSRVAVQCKVRQRPVGNGAVQEAEAGRLFYDCAHAVVVSDAGFTTSARQLAGKTGVALLHSSELVDYEPTTV
jgi:restriction system protein